MPRLRVPLAPSLLLAAAVWAGCGGGGSDETSAADTAQAEAREHARSVNLRAGDVPYFEPIPDEEDEDPKAEERLEEKGERCLGLAAFPEPLADVSSQTFGADAAGSIVQVESTVTVSREADGLEQELEMLRRPRAIPCLRRFLTAALKLAETTSAGISNVTLKRIPLPTPEIEDGIAYRFKTTVTVHRDTAQAVVYRPAAPPPSSRSIDAYIDLLYFTSGTTGVTLTAMGIPTPVGKSLERNLLRVLHERATGH
jgi:hypothetical protein